MSIRSIIIIVIAFFMLFTTSFTYAPVKNMNDDIDYLECGDDKSTDEQFLKKDTLKEKQLPKTKIIIDIIKELSDIQLEEAVEIANLIVNYSDSYELEPLWMLAIMYTESEFKNDAVSSENARGLMQLIPSTASYYGVTESQLHSPAINIDIGFQYYRYLLDIYKDQRMATIAYNQGPGNVNRGTYKTWYHERVSDAYSKILTIKEKIEEEFKNENK